MKDLKKASCRIQQYYIFFSNKDSIMEEDIENGFTIERLSVRLGINPDIIRRDIASLFSMPENGYLYFDSDEDVDDLDPNELRKKFISGSLDTTPIVSAMPFHYAESEVPVAIDANESSIISGYSGVRLPSENTDTDYLVKRSYRFRITQGLIEHLQTIDHAIDHSCSVTIRYFDPRVMHNINIEIYPVRLFYDSTDNIYAVIAAFDNFTHLYTYRLDRMVYASLNKNRTWDKSDPRYKPLFDKLAYEPYVWDRNYDYITLAPVKILFENAGNVWNKVRKELVYHTNGKLYEEESDVFGRSASVLIYEDKVSGMNSFRRWLAGYGRSAYVCEPESLRQEMITAIKKQLENYNSL